MGLDRVMLCGLIVMCSQVKINCLIDASPNKAIWGVMIDPDRAFFHHYQGSIDFNTVNIHRTVGMYFLVSTGNRGDIE